VTDAHPEDEQTVLAETLTKFLNARVEAMEKAIEHDALLQRIIQ
jgi:recombinational DNA repair protein RecT